MYDKIKIGIIGAGRWGMNHVKTAVQLVEQNNIIVCDFNEATGVKLKNISENIRFTTNLETVLNDKDINAVIISTPAETHFEIAKKCLENGKNILVEKPITLNVEEAEELYSLSIKYGLILMVGHVLLYHPAVLKMKKEIEKGMIGKLQYLYSNRLNLGAIRSEENILWSFAPHDISIIQYIVNDNPIEITAKGGDFIQNGIEDTTMTFLTYPGNIKAHIFVSWLHPFKEQRMVVIGDKGMFVFEDSLKTEKLKFYKKGFHTVNGNIEKFESEYEVIDFENKMPLSEEHKHFYESIIHSRKPISDGKHAVEVLKILEKASEELGRISKVVDEVMK